MLNLTIKFANNQVEQEPAELISTATRSRFRHHFLARAISLPCETGAAWLYRPVRLQQEALQLNTRWRQESERGACWPLPGPVARVVAGYDSFVVSVKN